jgi:hypothetical protein
MGDASFGEIMLISELPLPCDGTLHGSSVCITGHVVTNDAREDRVIIQHGGASLIVSTALLCTGDDGCPHFVNNATCRFIGELQETRAVGSDMTVWHRTLVARVVSAVDGLNMKLYAEALKVQRDFLHDSKTITFRLA